MKRGMLWALVLSVLGMGGIWSAQAATFNSSNFSINGNIGDSAAGAQTSTNYNLVSAAGESIVGNGSSGSYKLGQGYIAQLEKALELRVQPKGLIGYYSLDQGVGTTVVDDSVNNNSGTFLGTPTWTAGKIGSALTGFSANDYVNIDADSTYNVSAITVCTWMNLTAPSTNPVGVSRALGSPDTSGMWSVGFNGGSIPRVRMFANGTNNSIDGTEPLGTGTWNHVCFTYGGADFVLYVNGTEQGRETLNDPMVSYSRMLRIGVLSSGSQPLNGQVDEVKIFDRVLEKEEIESEYNAGNAGVPAGIAFAGGVTPGASNTVEFDSIVQTDASGYSLAISQNNELTRSGGGTIPGIAGSIESPAAWNEGATKGLGFTLYGTNATALPGAWGSGASYAALPSSGTTFYTRTGVTGGDKDYVNMRLRLDVATSQTAGNYTNQMIITGTMTP